MPPPRRSGRIPVGICKQLRIQALTLKEILAGPDGTTEDVIEIADPADVLQDDAYPIRVVKQGGGSLLTILLDGGKEQTIELASRPAPKGDGALRWSFRCRCGGAANVLYRPIILGATWRCRKCWRVAYPSQMPPDRYARAFQGDQFAFADDFQRRYGSGPRP